MIVTASFLINAWMSVVQITASLFRFIHAEENIYSSLHLEDRMYSAIKENCIYAVTNEDIHIWSLGKLNICVDEWSHIFEAAKEVAYMQGSMKTDHNWSQIYVSTNEEISVRPPRNLYICCNQWRNMCESQGSSNMSSVGKLNTWRRMKIYLWDHKGSAIYAGINEDRYMWSLRNSNRCGDQRRHMFAANKELTYMRWPMEKYICDH